MLRLARLRPLARPCLPRGIQRRWFIEEIDRAFEKVEKESAKKGGKASLLKEYLAAINVDRTRFLAENPSFNNTKPAFLVSDLEVEGLYRAEKGAAERLMPLVEPELSSLAPGELWEDRVFETPLAFDESFAFSAREVGPCPAGFSSFQRSFIVGSEIWCFNPAANRMEFFDPETETWVKHHRHELPIKLASYSFGERQQIAERRRRQMSRLNRRGVSRFKAMKDRFLNRFSFLEYFVKRPSKTAKSLEEGIDVAETLKPVSELIKPLSEYNRVELDRLDHRHFVIWRQEHLNVAGTLEIFDTSLSTSQEIEFPPISTDLLANAQFVCAKGFIFLAVDPNLVFSNHNSQPMLEYVQNRVSGAMRAFPGIREAKVSAAEELSTSRKLTIGHVSIDVPMSVFSHETAARAVEATTKQHGLRREQPVSNLLVYNYETVRWEPVPLRQIVGENELPLPFIPHFKAVKSADSSSIHFLSENGTGYTLDIASWTFKELSGFVRPIMRPGAVAFAASEKFICALGGHTQYFVKEPEKVFELKMEAKKKPPRSAINMLMRLVLYPLSISPRNWFKRTKPLSVKRPKLFEAQTLSTRTIDVLKRRYYTQFLLFDFDQRRWVKPIVSHEKAKLPPIAFTSIVPYKDKLFLIGGESVNGATKKVLSLDRISAEQLEAKIAELQQFIEERKERLFGEEKVALEAEINGGGENVDEATLGGEAKREEEL